MQAFTQIKSEATKKGVQKISLLALPPLKSPVIYGLRKPCILIPDALKLSESEWRYVLLHEVNHYLHKDLYKILITYYLYDLLVESFLSVFKE